MMQVLIKINVEVDSVEEAKYIARDLHKILYNGGVTNIVTVEEETFTNKNHINDDKDNEDNEDDNTHCPYCGSSKVIVWEDIVDSYECDDCDRIWR